MLLVLFPSQPVTSQDLEMQTNIIPRPEKIQKGEGFFLITPLTIITVQSESGFDEQLVDYFQDYLERHYGFNLISASDSNGALTNSIFFTSQGADKSLGDEGYELDVGQDKIEIRANKGAGFFYAVQTLLQLFPDEPPKAESLGEIKLKLPVVTITDKPRFVWRGMHLDVCRHFFPKEFIKKYIDLLAVHKMNVFHWHLTEDQGWRIEIKQYPKLTEIGAWRVDREDQHWNERTPPQEGEKATYGGYYTQDEIKEIVQYAQDRYITVVPEIEMPGHAVAALAAYPELSCTGGPFYVMPGGYWPITNIFCVGNDKTFEFLENVLTEVIDLFPSPYIHIGGDEAHKANWEKCPKCQERIRAENLKDEDELQSYFIRRIEKFLISKNKKLIGWDEILEGGLAPEATVMSWRGTAGGFAAASQGHDVVMTPNTHCYFDYYQARENEPLAIGGFLPVEKVYEYEPIPDSLTADKHKHILGVQGSLWTEYISDEKYAEYMALPRMCALAEVAWSAKEQRNPDDFFSRLSIYYDRLDALEVNYRHPLITGYESENIFIEPEQVTLAIARQGVEIRYTLDGTEPDAGSTLYTGPITINKNIELKAQAFRNGEKTGKLKSGVFEHREPLKAVQLKKTSPGLQYQYFSGEFQSVNDLEKSKPENSGIAEAFVFPEGCAEDYFGLVYNGYIKVPETGIYTFYLNSNDGSELFIGDKSLLSNDGKHRAQIFKAQIALQKGFHPVKILFFETDGREYLEVGYAGPGIPRQPVPGTVVYH